MPLIPEEILFDEILARLPVKSLSRFKCVSKPWLSLFDEILARLPVKSLSRFKCVSKPWLSLIESDRFIKIQYRNSAKNPRVIKVNTEVQGINGRFSLQSLLGSTEGSVIPTNINPKVGDQLLGCCNGVVCCYEYRLGRFSLWNPATRVSVILPNNGGRNISMYGVGWDESSDAYKVFAGFSERRNSDVRSGWVYSSNINSWRNIRRGCPPVSGFSGMFLRGNLHWVDWGHSHIVCFDLGREEFGRIELTFKDELLNNLWCFPELGEIGGSIGLLLDGKKRIEVWVMKEYGVKDSWHKLLTFPPAFSEFTIYPCSLLFGEGPNGEIFVRFGNNLTVYSPKDDAFSTVTSKDPFYGAQHIYVESLVSPKRILDATNTTS